jgi:hypothetical protein
MAEKLSDEVKQAILDMSEGVQQVHRWRKQQKNIELDAAMELKYAKAQSEALISIAESLAKLASCVQAPNDSRPYLRTK